MDITHEPRENVVKGDLALVLKTKHAGTVVEVIERIHNESIKLKFIKIKFPFKPNHRYWLVKSSNKIFKYTKKQKPKRSVKLDFAVFSSDDLMPIRDDGWDETRELINDLKQILKIKNSSK